MAATVAFGPVAPASLRRSSLSSSPLTSASSSASSESPRTTTTFSISVRHVTESTSPPNDDVTPKVEELDDDDVIDPKVEAIGEDDLPFDAETPRNEPANNKRPRGRPRKHPKVLTNPIQKAPKGRSKTGCITCRRRKKKCDEAKPTCDHCRKNNVVCEGYPPKTYWGGGKGKGNKERRLSVVNGPRDLPQLIEGLESELDWFFFDHFNTQMSRVLSLWTDKNNPFKELLLPMAVGHKGLMHSVLCLSGSHLQNRAPSDEVAQRQAFHLDRALHILQNDKQMQRRFGGDDTALVDDPVVAQTLVLLLQSICAGEVDGGHRAHLEAAKALITTQESKREEFQAFIIEFFIYHDVSSSVTSRRPSLLMMENLQVPLLVANYEAGIFLGVMDGLFVCWSRIRQLRDRIRYRRENDMRPVVDYQILTEAQSIDQQIRSWPCNHPINTPRHIAAMLYRQCTWLYLFRTIHQSRPHPQVVEAVNEGLTLLAELPNDCSEQSVMLMPLFMLGISAYLEDQRTPLKKAFETLHNYSSLNNIKHTERVVERVWGLMDTGDEASTWDWEQIMKDMVCLPHFIGGPRATAN